jgi:hypothetical protein
MKYLSATLSFVFVFAAAFFLAGWFLMPYLPPLPHYAVSVYDIAYWKNNWSGYLLGVVFGFLSARSVVRHADSKGQKY